MNTLLISIIMNKFIILLIRSIIIYILLSNCITQPNKTIKCSDRSWFIGMFLKVAIFCVAASLVLAQDCKGHEVMNFLDTK